MIIRAKDLASAELARIGTAFGVLDAESQAAARSHIQQGSALAGLGVAMTAAGVAALGFFKNSADAAREYNNEAALTLTQVDQLGVSLEDVAGIGKRVAREVAAPFDEMQSALYDIFSSMDVTVAEAERLLKSHAQAAVAGQTSIQNAGRATIAIMNAYGISVEDVDHVLDVQFKTVQKGVITYEQFASVIGRVIPSAVKAGQSLEDVGGAMAFATRNGLSAAMAATGLARAYDLLANPGFGKALHAVGIEVADSEGKFRSLVDVTADLRKHFEGMSPQAVAAELKEMTKGAGGTIQAMRILNLAINDSSGLFREMTDEVNDSEGAFKAAYEIMANTPAAKIQALKNSWEVLKVEIGDRVLPVIGELAERVKSVIDWFLELDPKILDQIIHWGKLVALWLTLTGILVTLHGGFMILQGVMALLGGSILKVIATTSGWGLLAAAIIFLVTKTEILQAVWEKLSGWAKTTLAPVLSQAWEDATEGLDGFLLGLREGDVTSNGFVGVMERLGVRVRTILLDLKQNALDFWFGFNNRRDLDETANGFETFGARVGVIIEGINEGVRAFWLAFNGNGVTSDGFVGLMEEAGVKARAVFEDIKTAWRDTLNYLVSTIKEEGFAGAIAEWGKLLWHWIEDATPIAIQKLGDFGTAAVDWIINTGLPWLIENIARWGGALVGWVADALPKVIEAMGNLTTAVLRFLDENLPQFVYAAGRIIESLVMGLLEHLPDIIGAFIAITAAIIFYIATKLIPEVVQAWLKISTALGDTAMHVAGAALAVFVEVGSKVVDYIVTDLVPSLIRAFLGFVTKFGAEVGGKIVDVVTSPFKKLKDLLVGHSIIPETVDDSLAEWDRFKTKSGQTFDTLSTDLTGKTTSMKGSLVKLFQETGTDSHDKWKEALSQMPGSTQEISDDTYQAITNVLSGLPGWTQGAGNETQAQWVAQLGKGTGGTHGTTQEWASAMLSILNSLLSGVGAAPVSMENTGPGDMGWVGNANGNILEFAKGGMEDHVAQIAKTGDWRVWAEPETGGEAYIPLAKHKRGRSVSILKEVADRFGLALSEYADGDIDWPQVPNFSPFGDMIGDRGGFDPTTYTRNKIIEWDNARKEALAAQQAASGVGGGSLGGSGWQAITDYLDSQGVPYTITSTTGGQHAEGSYHYQGKAVDMVSDNMMQIFNTLTQVGGSLAELFYDPAGWYIKNGARVEGAIGGHEDHVHGAVFDQGGILEKGLSMVMNGTGAPEAVFNPEQFQAIEWLMGHAEQVAEASSASDLQGTGTSLQGAAGAATGHAFMGVGGRPGYAPSLGMLMETVAHTNELLASNATGLEKVSALTGAIGSVAVGVQANRPVELPGFGGYGNPAGIGGSSTASNVPSHVFGEGAFQFSITGSNPEQIAALVETRIRTIIADLRMRR